MIRNILYLVLAFTLLATVLIVAKPPKYAITFSTEKETVFQVVQPLFAYDDTNVYVVVPHFPPTQYIEKMIIYLDNKEYCKITSSFQVHGLCTFVNRTYNKFVKVPIPFGRHVLKVVYTLRVYGVENLFFLYLNKRLSDKTFSWKIEGEVPKVDGEGFALLKKAFDTVKSMYKPNILPTLEIVVPQDLDYYLAKREANCVVYSATLLKLLSSKVAAVPVIGMNKQIIGHEWVYVLPPYDCHLDVIFSSDICDKSTDNIILLIVPPISKTPITIADVFEYELHGCKYINLVMCGYDISADKTKTKYEFLL